MMMIEMAGRSFKLRNNLKSILIFRIVFRSFEYFKETYVSVELKLISYEDVIRSEDVSVCNEFREKYEQEAKIRKKKRTATRTMN